MNNILEIQNLTKRYEQFSLKGVSFVIPQGYIMGFIGPNGAGKTTTLKSILNMVKVDEGEIQLFGDSNRENQQLLKQEIGVVMDTPFYVDEWQVKDVQAALAPFYTAWDPALFLEYLSKFGIERTKKVKELSRGMKVKLMLASALAHHPRLLILDEPTSGLDPVARDELMDILKEYISDEQNGVLFSTHITTDLERIADYITYINHGEIFFTGEKDELMETYVVIKGGLSELNQEQRRKTIGYREHSVGFEAMLQKIDLGYMPKTIVSQPASLDDIIIYFSKEGETNA